MNYNKVLTGKCKKILSFVMAIIMIAMSSPNLIVTAANNQTKEASVSDGDAVVYEEKEHNSIENDENIEITVSSGDLEETISEEEIIAEETDPYLDSDEDSVLDINEIALGWDPNDPDSDDDGLPDGYEWMIIQDIVIRRAKEVSEDGGASEYKMITDISPHDDYDKDCLWNAKEYEIGTNPLLPDSDGDGVKDVDELYPHGLNPMNYDTDGDGMGDGLEFALGLDPKNPDSDNDGVIDGEEITTQTIQPVGAEEIEYAPYLLITGKGDYTNKIRLIVDEEYFDSQEETNEKNQIHSFSTLKYRFEVSEDISFEELKIYYPYSWELRDQGVVENYSVAQIDEYGVLKPLDTTIDIWNHKWIANLVNLNPFYLMETNTYYETLNNAYLIQESVNDTYGDSEYILLDEALTFKEADKYADLMDAEIVTVDSEDEKEFLDDFIEEYGTKDQYWIGQSKDDTFSSGNLSLWQNGVISGYERDNEDGGKESDGLYHYKYHSVQTFAEFGFTDRMEYWSEIVSPLPLFMVRHCMAPNAKGSDESFFEFFVYDEEGIVKESTVTLELRNIIFERYDKTLTLTLKPGTLEAEILEFVYLGARSEGGCSIRFAKVIHSGDDLELMENPEDARNSITGYTTYESNLPTFSNMQGAHMYFLYGDINSQINPNADTLKAQQTKTGIILERKRNPNRICNIYLVDQDELIQIGRDPYFEDYSVDSDNDGIPDLVELEEQVSNYIPRNKQRELSKEEQKEVQGWTCRSNPDEKDTDHDGLRDDEDQRPKAFDLMVKSVLDPDVLVLNTNKKYFYIGTDINRFLADYDTGAVNVFGTDGDRAIAANLDVNALIEYTPEEIALLWTIDQDGVKYYVDRCRDQNFKLMAYHAITGDEPKDSAADSFFRVNTVSESKWARFGLAVTQLIKGKYNDEEDNTVDGTAMEIAASFTGVDFIQDGRDLTYDIGSWFDDDADNDVSVGETLLDGIGLIPVIGIVKNSDEVIGLFKVTDKLAVVKKFSKLSDIQTTGRLFRAGNVLRTAKTKIKEFGAKLLDKVLSAGWQSKVYRTKIASKGIFGNEVVDVIVKYQDELCDLSQEELIDVMDQLAIIAYKDGIISDEAAKKIIKEATKHSNEVIGVARKLEFPISVNIKGKTYKFNSADEVWNLKAVDRGNAIEAILAKTEYGDWFNCGQLDHGTFPVIDFQKDLQVVSLKSLDPRLSSYSGNKAAEKITEYLEKLDREIYVGDDLAERILEVRVPKGTSHLIDRDYIDNFLRRFTNISYTIKEF